MMASCSRKEIEKTEVPGFYKCVDDSVLHNGKLKIPRDFCWSSDGVVPQHCSLQTASGSWYVHVKMIRGEFFLEEGWEEFVVGNRLKLGDYLVLHYVGVTKFFVRVYGHNHCERTNASNIGRLVVDEDDVIVIDSDSDSEAQKSEISLNNQCPRVVNCGRKVSMRGRARNLATISPSGNQCFSVQMCNSHVTRGPLLTPRSFLRNIPKPEIVTLKVGNMAWNLKWIHPYQKSSRLSGGWLAFVNHNEVRAGDFCDFELISLTDKVAVMNVTIRRM